MLNTAMHRPRLRMLACILGELIAAFSLNYFIVPLANLGRSQLRGL